MCLKKKKSKITGATGAIGARRFAPSLFPIDPDKLTLISDLQSDFLYLFGTHWTLFYKRTEWYLELWKFYIRKSQVGNFCLSWKVFVEVGNSFQYKNFQLGSLSKFSHMIKRNSGTYTPWYVLSVEVWQGLTFQDWSIFSQSVPFFPGENWKWKNDSRSCMNKVKYVTTYFYSL